MKVCEVCIIGAGPSGMAAAVQLKRAGIETLLVERDEPGGLLKEANLVENYPGFPRGIKGHELARLMLDQVIELGISLCKTDAKCVSREGGFYTVETEGEAVKSEILVLASGTKPERMENVPEEAMPFVHYGLRALRSMEGALIAVLGAGDLAFDYALNLACKNKLIILNRSEKARCLALLSDRAAKNENINYLNKIALIGVKREGEKLALECRKSEQTLNLAADALLVSVGRKPCDELLSGFLKDGYNSLIEEGVLYLIGDIKNGPYRQTAICVGDGVRAAMEIEKKLRGGKR